MVAVRPADIPTSPRGYMSEEVFYQALYADAQEQVPDLIWPTSVRTYALMRRDPQLAAILSAYTLPIRRATWQIDPAGCRPEVVGLVADDLGLRVMGDDAPGPARTRGLAWHEHLRSALLHLTYGHMPFELVAELTPDNKQARLIDLSERTPHTITEIDLTRTGALAGMSQFALPGESTYPHIPVDRLLWYCHDREGAAWQGTSLLRPAYAPWLLKREMQRVAATANRRFGMGVPTVEWTPGTNPTAAQMAAAQQAASAARVGDQSGMAMPPGSHLVLTGLSGGVPDTVGFIKFLDQQMSRMVLAGFLDLGETSHGSRALGQSFVDLFMLSIQSIADYMADTLTRQVAARLVAWNWSEDEPVPAVVVNDVASTHEVTAEALAQLMQFGAITPDPALDRYVRSLWGLPDRTGPWQPPGKTGAAPGGPGPTPNPTPTPQPNAPDNTARATTRPRPRASRPGRHRAPHAADPNGDADSAGNRAPSTVEEQTGTDFAAHQQAHADALAVILTAWPALAGLMVAALAAAAGTAVASGDVAGLGQLTVPADVVTEVGDGLAAVMRDLAQHAAGQAATEAVNQGLDVAAPVDAGAGQVDQVAQAVAGVLANAYQTAAARAALVGTQAGTSAAEVETAVTEQLDQLSTADTGVVAANLTGAMSAAQAAGRQAVFTRLPDTIRYYASEILDSSTCEPCREIDGHEFTDLDDAAANYPIGLYRDCAGWWRCRGMLIAYLPPTP